ncbi:uncharacterized protein LOC131438953 [Malaya genurostris]|uniref:uncharacterized protein LOC131438953 n=1 Tax=Malaya genurostris TaxID=325434 RepID=UPI0026F3A0A2|nr:uncharacterized protein LOC131438953 [Malaya genurostris]
MTPVPCYRQGNSQTACTQRIPRPATITSSCSLSVKGRSRVGSSRKMEKVFVLISLWILFEVVTVSAGVTIDCEGQINCRVLGQNQQDIQAALSKYPSAKQVDLHGNLLESFDALTLQSLTGLQVLNLSYNLLQEDVLRSIRNLQLKTVDLTYNQLTVVSVPSSVTTFIAKRNKLHHIVIPSNNALLELHLPMNQLESLNELKNIRNLVSLDLSCNRIRALDLGILSQVPSLATLNLANNFINVLSLNVKLPNLRHLDLSNNILTVMDGAFSNIPKLTELHLQNNKIVMAIDIRQQHQNLKFADLTGNDWYCKSLEAFLTLNPQATFSRDSASCPSGNFKNVCCSYALSPFADRLIQYRWQKFKALETGTGHRQSGVSCAELKPSPCDGDDGLVYKVATSEANDAQSISRSKQQQLEDDIRRHQNQLRIAENRYSSLHRDVMGLSSSVKDLEGFISTEYEIAGLQGEGETSNQLRNIFQRYDEQYNQFKADINAEERTTGSKQIEITAVESQLQELEERKQRLLNDIGERNRTVTGYLQQIDGLNKRIG